MAALPVEYGTPRPTTGGPETRGTPPGSGSGSRETRPLRSKRGANQHIGIEYDTVNFHRSEARRAGLRQTVRGRLRAHCLHRRHHALPGDAAKALMVLHRHHRADRPSLPARSRAPARSGQRRADHRCRSSHRCGRSLMVSILAILTNRNNAPSGTFRTNGSGHPVPSTTTARRRVSSLAKAPPGTRFLDSDHFLCLKLLYFCYFLAQFR